MHPAPAFHERDRARLAALMRAHPFALVLANGPQAPVAAHAPVLVEPDGARLRFHLSRMSPTAAALAQRPRARIVATGPHAYVSPDWYGLPDQVPTWNYLSAEAEGPLRQLDREESAALLDDLSAFFEAALAPKKPWTRDKMAQAAFERLLAGIVSYEMTIETFEGVAKLNQNKSAEARAGVAEALAARPEPFAAEIAARMRYSHNT